MADNHAACRFCDEDMGSEPAICHACGLSQSERLLVDWEIRHLIENDTIIIDPLISLEHQLSQVGLDLRLDVFFREFLHMRRGATDLAVEIPEQESYLLRELDLEKSGDEYYFIQPGDFVLTQSMEYVVLPNFICGRLGGRSALAKSGIEVHATSARVDPGFSGHLTLELKNVSRMPVKVYPMQRIAHLMFEITPEVEKPYDGTFQHQVRIKPPKPDPDLIQWLESLRARRARIVGPRRL